MEGLWKTLSDRARRLGVPLSAHLDLTYRCNESCVHCYLDHRSAGSEMSTSDIRSVLRDLASAGSFFLLLSGGEPFLRADALDIVEYARTLSFHVLLKTNATMIGAAHAWRMAARGVHQVDVSVYSTRPAIHDKITGLPGSLRLTLQGIGSCGRRDCP
jgi:MoaA/NifB/PqqE/SkfB family radical SAM enzyme